ACGQDHRPMRRSEPMRPGQRFVVIFVRRQHGFPGGVMMPKNRGCAGVSKQEMGPSVLCQVVKPVARDRSVTAGRAARCHRGLPSPREMELKTRPACNKLAYD